MPLPIPLPSEPAAGQPSYVQPYYVRDRQGWAVDQERMRHNQALFTVGEYSMFVLMWHIQDHNDGLVARCSTCWDTDAANSIKSQVADVYKQPEQHRCPDCFGTTFEGGFKAQIIRPAIFSDSDEGEQHQARGVAKPEDLSVESTPDFRVRNGDFVFRATGDRYQLRVPQRVTLRTGFGTPTQAGEAIGYNHARAALEDPTSVAYIIPPNRQGLETILVSGTRVPFDFTQHETIRAPLIPASNP